VHILALFPPNNQTYPLLIIVILGILSIDDNQFLILNIKELKPKMRIIIQNYKGIFHWISLAILSFYNFFFFVFF
jgi:hypothetical protein